MMAMDSSGPDGLWSNLHTAHVMNVPLVLRGGSPWPVIMAACLTAFADTWLVLDSTSSCLPTLSMVTRALSTQIYDTIIVGANGIMDVIKLVS